MAALALFLRGVLPFREGTSVYQLPIAAVVLSAWYGGRGPGLLASLICVTGASYFFVPPVHSFETAPDHVLPLGIFAVLCLLLTEFSAGRRRAERGLRARDEELKRAEAERQAHVRFLESMDRINRAIQSTNDLDQMLGRALDEVFDIFQCDRVVLGRHSGESETASFTRLARRERPGFLLDLNLGVEVAADEGLTAMSAGLKAARGPVQWVLGSIPPRIARHLERVGVQSVLSMPIEPKTERPDYFYVFTLRQCTYPRVWTPEEERLFVEIGRRLGDATVTLSTLRDLRESERRLEAAQRLARVGWWERDYVTGRVSLSEETCRIFGVQAVDLPQWRERWVNLIHPDDRQKTAAASESALGGGPRYDVEYRVVRPDGKVRVVHSHGDVTWDESGRPVRQFGAMQDITELREAEDDLRESEAYLTEAQRLSHTGSWALDVASNRYLYTSPEFDRIFGLDPQADALTREAVLERMHPEDRSGWMGILEKSVREKLDTTSQYRIVLPDGGVRHIHTIRHPVMNSAGEVVKLVGTSIDVTEHKRAEEEREKLRLLEAELAHANRVKALGELTTSIVHEVSQPLGAMIASAGAGARWLAAEPPNLTEARATLDNIAADGTRAREVITRIRSLMKRQVARVETLDVNRKIREVLAITEHELRSHHIALRTELDTALPHVAGDRVQLQQVILNLILNAVEAMSGVEDRPRELTIVSRQDGSKAVVVEVRDSGTGLGAAKAEEVFDAFYTTKAEGLGIGLSISRSIVEAHGGRLWATPNEPHGAIFRFSLPVAEEGQS